MLFIRQIMGMDELQREFHFFWQMRQKMKPVWKGKKACCLSHSHLLSTALSRGDFCFKNYTQRAFCSSQDFYARSAFLTYWCSRSILIEKALASHCFSLKREWTRETKLQNELGQQDYQASVEKETETMLLPCKLMNAFLVVTYTLGLFSL